jgi:hypothetical protein
MTCLGKRSICIVSDCNEDIGQDPALMAKICTTHALVDVMDILHPDDSHISSYARGSTRLNYALVSQDLLPHLAGAGLNHYHDFYPSDHRPIFVGLHASLFGPIPAFASHRFRFVHSNSKMVATFVTLAHKHLCDTGTSAHHSGLMTGIDEKSPSEISRLANSIDTQVTRALLSAEKKCKKPQREPWSEDVHFASLHVKYWRLKCAATANSYDATTTLADVCKLLPPTREIIDDGLKTDKQYLNAAHRLLVRMRQDAEQFRKAFLQELRERLATRKTPAKLSPEESLKRINKQLQSTANFSHIKKVLQPSTPSPLTKVHVTTVEQTVDPTTGQPTTIMRNLPLALSRMMD